VNLVCAGLVWSTETNGRLAGNHGWLVRVLSHFNGTGNRFGIMTINSNRVPARGAETCVLVCGIRDRDRAIDRDVVVIPENNELVQLQMASKRNRFLRNAFHQAAVTCDDIGVVVLEVGPEFGREFLFGNRHAHGIGNALTEWTGRGFNACGMAIFRMASGFRTNLAEILDLVDCHVRIAGEMQDRVEKHRAMTSRQNKPVAIWP